MVCLVPALVLQPRSGLATGPSCPRKFVPCAQCLLLVARLSVVLAQAISLFVYSFNCLRCVLLLVSVMPGARFCHHLLPREESSLRRLVRAESRPCFYYQVFSFACPALRLAILVFLSGTGLEAGKDSPGCLVFKLLILW
jgi:hypothetical protein